MKEKKPQKDVPAGEFPYPLWDGPEEPRYLTWVRNHSNYMAERGFLDYLRLAAVLVRGILINFLTLLPYLMVLSLIVSFIYGPVLRDWNTQIESQTSKFFLTKNATEDGWWTKWLQDGLYGRLSSKYRSEGTVAGEWSADGTLTTTLTVEGEDGSTTATVATDLDGATTVEEARDLHLSDLERKTGLFGEITWSASGADTIKAVGGQRFDLSAAARTTARNDNGAFTYATTEKVVPTPYLVTPIVLALAGLWVLAFPIVSRLFRVSAYRKTLETGSTSSVKLRDLFERSFGGLLLAIIAAVVIESLPLLVHSFHQVRAGALGFPTIAGALGVLVVANKVLPLLGGVLKKLVIGLVGAIGLLIPLLVVLLVVDFVVYPPAYRGFLIDALFGAQGVIAVVIVGTLLLSLGSLEGKGLWKLLSLLAGIILLFVAIVALCVLFLQEGNQNWNFVFVLAWTVVIWVFCWLSIDVNLTSINGLYRDRLASAFLVGKDTKGDVDIEQDVDLQEICHYDAGSTAPYHLVNVTHNLQSSKDMTIRERNSDFFVFSKKFIGGDRTGYCRSEDMELVYPQVDLGTAMAISAAAASPNMGRGTNPLFVAFLTLLNVRLGFWIPHPGRLEEQLSGERNRKYFRTDVFPEELVEIERRREQAYQSKTERPIDANKQPTIAHGLFGIGFSGGGIRSATINLGIAQALDAAGVFNHIDYMSTVSGGGYLGSSISTLMRYKTKIVSEIAGTVSVKDGNLVQVRSPGSKKDDADYRYAEYAKLDEKIKDGAQIEAGQRLLRRRTGAAGEHSSLWSRFQWRVRPGALLREMLSMLDEDHKWVNLSDGGHLENLAGIELLRRRCKYIIIGDGEADPNLHFNGLAALIRYARIDLGIDIDINPDAIRVDNCQAAVEAGLDNLSEEHWAIGTITYPKDEVNGLAREQGYLLYLKSSFTGDEDEVIEEYRHRNPAFPHESTADQFFDEGQFEAYRALGQHIGEQALERAAARAKGAFRVSDLDDWFTKLWEAEETRRAAADEEADRMMSEEMP